MENPSPIFTKQVRDMMLRLARTLLYDQEEAMDTVQDVLEKLWRKQDIRRNILLVWDSPERKNGVCG